jgi:hypothetical protein
MALQILEKCRRCQHESGSVTGVLDSTARVRALGRCVYRLERGWRPTVAGVADRARGHHFSGPRPVDPDHIKAICTPPCDSQRPTTHPSKAGREAYGVRSSQSTHSTGRLAR